MTDDATGQSASREDALRAALARHRETLTAKAAEIERKRAAGKITVAAQRDQLHAAHAAYDRDCALAEVEVLTGWQTWTGIGGVLYARRPKASPPKVVRAADVGTLREAIHRAETGCTPAAPCTQHDPGTPR